MRHLSHVTRAIQAVAASRVQRAQAQLRSSRTYLAYIQEIVTDLLAYVRRQHAHPYLDVRPDTRRVLIVLMGGDRGLSGAFNHNLLLRTLQFARTWGKPTSYVAVGRRCYHLLQREGAHVIAAFPDRPVAPVLHDTFPIMRVVTEEFEQGRADEAWVAYSRFVDFTTQVPEVQQLLPVPFESFPSGRADPSLTFIFEPDGERLLDEALVRWVEMILYHTELNTGTSELAARTIAMRAATDNASAIVKDMTLQLNKLRQDTITRDLSDITAGAEVLIGPRA